MKRTTIEHRGLRGRDALENVSLGTVRLRDCYAIGTSLDPADWPRISHVRVQRLELWDRSTTNGAIIEDSEVAEVATRGPIVLLAVVLRRVVFSGPTGALAVRQYGYVNSELEDACPTIRAATGDAWAVDLRRMIPTGHVEFSLVVEPWQVVFEPTYVRLVDRRGADRITDKDLAYVAAHDPVAATSLGMARANKFVRTRVLTSTSPHPPWFDYLDERDLTWQGSH